MTTHEFDKDYWQSHWQQRDARVRGWEIVPNPYLDRETSRLVPGTALDAGCGEGSEAHWLAAAGWQVTAVDISAAAIALASSRAAPDSTAERLRWVEADLSSWAPESQFDLVTTHYAHPAMPQLAFYRRISEWVQPGGSLLIVGHLHMTDSPGHGHQSEEHSRRSEVHSHRPPAEASATAASISAVLDADRWDIVTADEHARTLTNSAGLTVQLDDVIVRATRRR